MLDNTYCTADDQKVKLQFSNSYKIPQRVDKSNKFVMSLVSQTKAALRDIKKEHSTVVRKRHQDRNHTRS